MTEPYGYDDDPNDDDQDIDPSEQRVNLTRAQIRTLERDAKQARKANEELTTLRRELALTRAGLGDLTPAKQKALLANIDGDITVEAARAAAEELGFVQPPAEPETDPDQAAMERMSAASAGATDPGSEDSVAKLERAAALGKDALLAQIQADGHVIHTAG